MPKKTEKRKGNPFRTENPFQHTTAKAIRKSEEEDFLLELEAAVKFDPENKHGAW